MKIASSMNRSKTPFVTVEIKGIPEAIINIGKKGKAILNGTDSRVFQAAHLLGEEIQESIIGNRVELKSVDTGDFANSIEVDKIKDLEYSVETDLEYAKFLEFGTKHIAPRMHFRHSLARNKERIIKTIKGV